MTTPDFLAIARGDAPADCVLRNGRIINVFSGEIEASDLAIAGDRIAGIAKGYRGKNEIDLRGAFVAPGLIDAHVHIESSLCTPANFTHAVVPRGITTVVADPHEIANVAGLAGIRFIHDASRGLPLGVILMAPSCVPATNLADSGATLGPDDLAALLSERTVHGLAEVMNFPAVIAGEAGTIAKINSYRMRPIDGHAPGVTAKALNAYAAAGIGSDHECVSVEEAKEKLARGLYILIREATNARNLDTLLPLITPHNSRRICFCTDDRVPRDLLDVGSVDYMLRRAIEFGVDPIDAFRCCTLNPCEWFGLHDRGAIVPGRRADLVVFEDLRKPIARETYAAGKLVSSEGKLLVPTDSVSPPSFAGKQRNQSSPVDLSIPAKSKTIRVIGAREGQLITDALTLPAKVENGFAVADSHQDILKMAVIERHNGTGTYGLGFIRGFGLKEGAIAGTVAHDHHNLIVIGCDDRAMMSAIQHLQSIRGGMCVCDGQANVVASLPLPIAGLMSDKPIHQVRDAYDKLLSAAKALGAALHDPFMAMSFMALEVIPSLKLTNKGLVDVEKFALTSLFL
jgi:adenine deaminase